MSAPIDLVGPPDDLEALIALSEEPIDARLVLKGTLEGEFPVQVELIEPGLASLRASLPELTPPGNHRGILYFGRDARPAQIEIEPAPAAIVSPSQIVVHVEPGGRTERRFTIANRGNLPLLVRRAQVFGLIEEDGVESALSAAYRSSARGLDRLAFGIEDLAARHSLARVRFEKAWKMAPGEVSSGIAEIQWPESIHPGRVYIGTWPIASQRIAVRAHVAGGLVDQEAES